MRSETSWFWLRCLFYIALCEVSSCELFAHDVPVHEQITLNAVASAIEQSVGYNSFIAAIGGPVPLSVNGGPARSPML